MENAVRFKDSAEWRAWLEKNHDKKSYVWIEVFKKGFGKNGVILEEAVEEAICYGWIDGKLKTVDDEKFILRFSTRKANSVWSKINKERAQRLIALGRMTPAGLAMIEQAKKTVMWDNAYTNKTKNAIPSDLKDALIKESIAWKNFQGFANSYQNMYIGWVNSAKTTKTRTEKDKENCEAIT